MARFRVQKYPTDTTNVYKHKIQTIIYFNHSEITVSVRLKINK